MLKRLAVSPNFNYSDMLVEYENLKEEYYDDAPEIGYAFNEIVDTYRLHPKKFLATMRWHYGAGSQEFKDLRKQIKKALSKVSNSKETKMKHTIKLGKKKKGAKPRQIVCVAYHCEHNNKTGECHADVLEVGWKTSEDTFSPVCLTFIEP